MENKWAIVGLGNNKEEYTNTYHNIGFLAVDAFKSLCDLPGVVFYKPDSLMNNGGPVIVSWLNKQGIKPSNLILVHDDTDILQGGYKIDFNVSSAGHNGVKSLITSLGTQEFYRVRVGVRPEEEKIRLKAGDFVLKKIKNKKIFNSVITSAWEEICTNLLKLS